MKECAIVNSGLGAWAFQDLANSLAQKLQIEIIETPTKYNYVLAWDRTLDSFKDNSFISLKSLEIASNKRKQAKIFKTHNIPIPETNLIDKYGDVVGFINNDFGRWCIKYPIGCGASGHRIVNSITDIPQNWLKPYIVQEFIYLDKPMVYRIYAAGKKLFGWNVRRFPSEVANKPWVAHAQGAVYEILDKVPNEVIDIATKTLKVTNLFNSFGCVDLIQNNKGDWLVLEIGTDGIFNYVDRQLGNKNLEQELLDNVARAFWTNLS